MGRPTRLRQTLIVKIISLTQGQVALVDDEDYARLNVHKWCAQKQPLKNRFIFYAVRCLPRLNGKRLRLNMHHEVLGITGLGIKVDHKNSNGLDNQKENLRPATRSQNSQNAQKAPNCSSKLKGVCWHKRRNKWNARIQLNGQRQSLGYFESETDAGNAYDFAAKQKFREFARPNK